MRDTKTPQPVKRQLRREAGFGCCKCGVPILQYHHIIRYADEQHYRPEDMMALCPTCHFEATVGAMSEKTQRQLKARPYNIVHGRAGGLLTVNQTRAAAQIGSNIVAGDHALLVVQRFPLLSLRYGEDSQLLISVTLLDDDDAVLARVIDNEWVSGDASAWDIEASFQRLVIREGPGLVRLSLDLRTDPFVLTGKFKKGGLTLQLDRNKLVARYPDGRVIAEIEQSYAPGAYFDFGMDGKFSIRTASGHGIFGTSSMDKQEVVTSRLKAFHRFLGYSQAAGEAGFQRALRSAAGSAGEWEALVQINLGLAARLTDPEDAHRRFLAAAAIGNDEDAARAYCLVGQLATDLGDHTAAGQAWREAMRINHYLWSPRAAVSQAQGLLCLGERKEAEALLHEVCTSDNVLARRQARAVLQRLAAD